MKWQYKKLQDITSEPFLSLLIEDITKTQIVGLVCDTFKATRTF